MSALLGLSSKIDWLNEKLGQSVKWLVLLAVLISAGNAVVRKVFDNSSNALLEVQWYLFAAVFMLAAGYTLMRQEHVRIDVLASKFSKRTQIKMDIFGICVFLFPFIIVVTSLSLPLALRAFTSGEMSHNAGGLIRWPVFALLPLGLAFLGLQGVSELIKRVAFLKGLVPDPTRKGDAKSAEQELAEFLLQKEVAAREQAAQAAASSAGVRP